MAAPKKKPVEDKVVETPQEEVVVMIPEFEAAAEAPETPEVEEAPVEDGDVISVHEQQLNIYETAVLSVPAGAQRVEVENVGGGDLYVDSVAIQYDARYLLAPGQKKQFKNVSHVFVGSASRPTVRLTAFSK